MHRNKFLLIVLFFICSSTYADEVREFPRWSDTINQGTGATAYRTWGDWPGIDETPTYEELCGGKVRIYWPPSGTTPPELNAEGETFYPFGLDPESKAKYDSFFRPKGDNEGSDVQLIRNYICDIVNVYESRVGPFADPIRIFIARALSVAQAENPDTNDCNYIPSTILASYDPETKSILLPLGVSDTSIDPCPFQSIAHEVAHLIIDKKYGKLIDYGWLDEGGAEYLSSLIFAENNHPECYKGRYTFFSLTPYTPSLWPRYTNTLGTIQRKYNAYPFLHYLAEQLGDGPIIQAIKDAASDKDPAQLVQDLQMHERGDQPGTWLEYIQKVWGDQRYARCDDDEPTHYEKKFSRNKKRETIKLVPTDVDNAYGDNQCYAADYIKLTTEEAGNIIYRLHNEQIYGPDGISDAKEWIKMGAIVKTATGSWRQIDISGKRFVQFEKNESEIQDNINDDRAMIYHHGKEVILAISFMPKDPNDCNNKLPLLKGRELGIHFGLNNTWQLKQIRIGQGKNTKKAGVIGLMYLKTQEKDGKKYLIQKSRRFWPDFPPKRYERSLDEHEDPEAKAAFKDAKAMELYIETACYFAGTQMFELKSTDDTDELDQQLMEPQKWEERLEYELKSHKILLLDRPHKFRCDPTQFTSKMSALTMLGGGVASAAAATRADTGWLSKITGLGQGVVGDSWAQQLEDIFVNSITWGLGEEEGQEKTVALKFVPKNAERSQNYLVVKVNDNLHLIYQEVIQDTPNQPFVGNS